MLMPLRHAPRPAGWLCCFPRRRKIQVSVSVCAYVYSDYYDLFPIVCLDYYYLFAITDYLLPISNWSLRITIAIATAMTTYRHHY